MSIELLGIGKTTLVKKLIKKLNKVGMETDGFLTEEIRNDRYQRTGFGVQLLKRNVSRVLADKSNLAPNENIRKLGQYTIYVKDFEDTVIDTISNFDKGILIIDEIGKMELLSKTFENTVLNLFKNPTVKILATVPIKGPPTVENLKKDCSCQLFIVTQRNRDDLADEIFRVILNGADERSSII